MSSPLQGQDIISHRFTTYYNARDWKIYFFLFVRIVSLIRHTLSLFNVRVVFITYLCDFTHLTCVLSSYIQRMSDWFIGLLPTSMPKEASEAKGIPFSSLFLYVCSQTHSLTIQCEIDFITYLCDITHLPCVFSSYLQRMSDCIILCVHLHTPSCS